MRVFKSTSTYFVFIVVLLAMIVAGCSTQKNTARSRWWHSFNARYNTYYNGTLAYIDGSLEKENGNRDNFTDIIPLYTVGNKGSRELGKGNFDKAIEKCEKAIKLHSIKKRPVWDKNRRKTERDIEWLGRKEYNPFLWKAWLLMGRSQFYEGKFDEAASTFAYMSRLYQTQPAIYGRARAWLAKSYVEQDWMYDAEDVIRNMERDSIHWRAQKEWDYTYADYYIHKGDYEKAIPYLRKVIKHEMRRKQRAREWYLMGQLQEVLGHKELAYKAYQHVVRQNPPYEIEFNARIAMTEVMAGTQAKKMIGKLRRMAASDNNKEYLDQVYYAIGNIYLAQRDTTNAIAAYERGNKEATRSGIEKGVLLLKLGDIYWDKERYGDAQRCYGEAIGLLDKERSDYEQLSERSKILDELAPYTDAVQLQDSLQVLAALPEKDRNAAIDRVIEALKQKEKEEKNRLQEQNAAQVMNENAGQGRLQQPGRRPMVNRSQDNGMWYFYNQMAINQGKQQFQKLWGKRENADNWQRSNKTVVAMGGDLNAQQDLLQDSLLQAEAIQDSIAALSDSLQNDPHRREYYLAQIPFTPEQKEASNQIIMDGLFHSGVIFKDKLDNLALSEKALRRLTDTYTSYQQMDEAYYHLFLLYSRRGEASIAANYLQKLQREYPKSNYTILLSDPNFIANSKFGVHIEDSLYAATYAAFKADRLMEVRSNTQLSASRFPLGANRDKFLFVGGLGKLNSGDADGCLNDMQVLVDKFPESRLGEMAGMIINGVKAGKKLRGGRFDIGNVWSRRAAVLSNSDSIQARQFSNERNADFLFVMAYHPDSLNENQLLYRLAKYNFTSYLVRNFDLTVDEDATGLHRMTVGGFKSYDEALQYARQLYQQTTVAPMLKASRALVISRQNLELIGQQFSYDDYDKFYAKHFAPLKVATFQLLTEPDEVTTERPQRKTIEEIDDMLEDGTFIDNGLEITPDDSGTVVVPVGETEKPANKGGLTIPDATNEAKRPTEPTVRPAVPVQTAKEQVPVAAPKGVDIPVNTQQPVTTETHTTVIPVDESPAKAPAVTPTKPVVTPTKPTVAPGKTPAVTPKKPVPTPAKPVPTPAVKPQPQPAVVKKNVPKKDEDVIYFDDEKVPTVPSAPKKKPVEAKKEKQKKEEPTTVDEDEYYDFDGF